MIKYLGLLSISLIMVMACSNDNMFVESDLVDIPSSVKEAYEELKNMVSAEGGDLILSDDCDLSDLAAGLSTAMDTSTFVSDLNKADTEAKSTAAKSVISDAIESFESIVNYSENSDGSKSIKATSSDLVVTEGTSKGGELIDNKFKLPAKFRSTIATVIEKLETIAAENNNIILTKGDVIQVMIVKEAADEIYELAQINYFDGSMSYSDFLKDDDVRILLDYAAVLIKASDKLSGYIDMFGSDFIKELIADLT